MGLLLYCPTLARCGMAAPPLEALFPITVKKDFIMMRAKIFHCAQIMVIGHNRASHAKVKMCYKTFARKMSKNRHFRHDPHPLPNFSLSDSVSAWFY